MIDRFEHSSFVLELEFHLLFRSGSMDYSDRRPLGNTPTTALITRQSNNRLGAVYSSLYGFWVSRQATLNAGGQRVTSRRDAYSLILFNESPTRCIENDFASSPDTLLNVVLPHRAGGGTNFTSALSTSQDIMQRCWSTERSIYRPSCL